MRILAFQARRFWWRAFSKTLAEVPEVEIEDEATDAVVAYIHVEARDQQDRQRVFRHTLKHLKWQAGKREWKRVVLHSFTHLGAENADPTFAGELLEELAARLRQTDYEVKVTPFGYFSEWELSVYGDSLAKVWKEI